MDNNNAAELLTWLEGYLDANQEGLTSDQVLHIREKIQDLRRVDQNQTITTGFITDSPVYGPVSGYQDNLNPQNAQIPFVFYLNEVKADTKVGRTTMDKTKLGDVLVAKGKNQKFLYAKFLGFSRTTGFAAFKLINNESSEQIDTFFTPKTRVKVAGRILKLPENVEVSLSLTLDDQIKEATSLKIGISRKKKKSEPEYDPKLTLDEQKMVQETAGLATMEALEEYHKKSKDDDARTA